LRVAVVSPAPLAPTRVRERIRIHSPSGARKKYRLISGLTKLHSRMSTICATPEEKSAACTACNSGVLASPSTRGTSSRIQAAAGPGFSSAPSISRTDTFWK
jgi:hypothetical protein